MNFSKKEIHYALLGNLLGDAYLRRNINTQHWVESVHTNKQREYVIWLKNLLTIMIKKVQFMYQNF